MPPTDNNTTYTTMKIVEELLAKNGIKANNDSTDILHFNIGKDSFEVQLNLMSATFWDVAWGWIDKNRQELEDFKTAVNFSNTKSSATIIYTEPDENGIIFIHTKRTVVFVPDWLGNESVLDDVFESFNRSRKAMDELFYSKME